MTDSIRFIILNTDNCFFYLKRFHENRDTNQNFLTMLQHQLVVAGQIRFAFNGIDNQNFCFFSGRRRKFHVSGESSTSQSDDAGILHFFNYLFFGKITFSFDNSTSVNGIQPLITIYINKYGRTFISGSIQLHVNLIYLT
ncbi:hypothetical protein SDC9_69310 [bioreactor metagenome]|uniref:Uncharacterized protein n=1 Tax=bioreactor metagenome TaxID=1076179 RepID=A0A644Y4J8_9ZZZZ